MTKNNEKNFWEISHYKVQGDFNLKIFLEYGETNKYRSNASQNPIKIFYNSLIVEKIVARVNDAKFFSILADLTVDISGVEFDLKKIIFCEQFLQFVQVHNTTRKGLKNLILESLKQFGAELKFLRG